LFQVDVGQDRADVGKAQRVEVLRILHGPEDRGPDRFVLAQVVRLDPIRRQGSRLVDVRDDLVEVLEGDGAVPEDLVPGCRTCEGPSRGRGHPRPPGNLRSSHGADPCSATRRPVPGSIRWPNRTPRTPADSGRALRTPRLST